MIIPKANFFFNRTHNPIDKIAWMSLKKSKQYFIQLLIEYNELRDKFIHIFNFLNCLDRKRLNSCTYTVSRFHQCTSCVSIYKLNVFVNLLNTFFKIYHQIYILLNQCFFKFILVFFLKFFLNRKH